VAIPQAQHVQVRSSAICTQYESRGRLRSQQPASFLLPGERWHSTSESRERCTTNAKMAVYPASGSGWPRMADPGDYPLSMWEQQRARYWEYWRHFGNWLDETISETDDSLRHPLKLNPFNMACMLHAGFLFGEVQDSADPLVTAVVEPWCQESEDTAHHPLGGHHPDPCWHKRKAPAYKGRGFLCRAFFHCSTVTDASEAQRSGWLEAQVRRDTARCLCYLSLVRFPFLLCGEIESARVLLVLHRQ